jgi:ABC-type dipeptide/oligopeptide/nickel transport system permease component
MAVPTLFGVSLIAFLLIHMVPGDPAQTMLFGSNASPAQIAGLRQQLGLNQPLWQQYAGFLGQLLHGNLGTSFVTQTSVAQELFSRLPSTLVLAASATLVAVAVGVPLGFLAGVRPNSVIDRIARAVSFLGVAIPYFWLALVMVLILSVNLNLLPPIDDGTPQALIIPAVSLGWGYAAILTRLIRAKVIEEYYSDYVKSARARGCSESRVLLRHAARNSVIPAVTTIGLQFGHILTGAAVTEVIFGRSGLGSFLAGSITAKNIPVVQGAVVVIGVGYVLINLVVDIIVGLIDPRTRVATAAV